MKGKYTLTGIGVFSFSFSLRSTGFPLQPKSFSRDHDTRQLVYLKGALFIAFGKHSQCGNFDRAGRPAMIENY
ncbi:MAG: hypothetical protein ACR2I2_22570 [Bryobacteraceae bacterium]